MIRLDRYFPLVLSLLFVLAPAMMRAADPGIRLLDTESVVHDGQPSLRLRVAVESGPGLLVPQEAGEWRREERHVTDPVTGEEDVWVLEGPAPDLSLRSFLVAVPDGFIPPAGPRSVEGELVDLATGEVVLDAGPIEGEVRPAQVGMVRAAQVFYRLPEIERAVEARFDVTFTPEAGPRRSIARQADRSVASLFVNPEDAVVLLPADRRSSTPELLQPPGDIRMSFTADHRVYRVPMASLGVDGETIGTVQLIHHGAVLPFDVEGEDIVFYAQRRVTDADTDDSVFVKLVEEDASPRLTTRPAFETLSAPEFPAEVEVVRNRRFDLNLSYQPAVVSLPVGSRFVYHRLRWPGNSTFPHFGVHQLPIHDVMTNTFVSMKVEMHGQNQSNSFNPDHYASVSLGGVVLPQTSWEGRTKHTANYNFTLSSLPVGPVESLTFQHQIPGTSPVTAAGLADEQALDVVDLTYLANPRLEGGVFGRMRLTPNPTPRLVTMGGLPPGTLAEDVLVLDVTNPSAPIRLLDPIVFPDATGTVAVVFEAPGSLSLFQVERLDNLAAPITVVESERLPDLPLGNIALRGLVVRDASLAEALQPWMDHRGPGILEFDPQAAYNAYNGGQSSPESLRSAIADLIEAAPNKVAVPFVFLIGHGSYDRKNYLGLKDGPWIPPFLEESVAFNIDVITGVGTTIENSVDFNFGLLYGEDNLLDVRLTRWPAIYPEDVTRAVNRSIAHDAAAPALIRTDRPAVFLADNEAQFINDQAIWSNLWSSSGFATLLMTRGAPVPELGGLTNTAAVRKALDRLDASNQPLGASFFFYTGHGNFDRFAGTVVASFDTNSNPVTNANLATFSTSAQWPIAATFTCLNGNYATPGQARLSMSEAWLFGSDFGAIANIAPCSVDYYNEQRLLQGAYLNQVGIANPANRAVTIGEMSHRASVQYATQYPSLMRTLREYIVFGDPVSLTTVVAQQAELIVTVESSVESVKDGVPFELTVTVENIGSSDARGLELQLPLPTGVTALGIESDWGGTSTEGGVVSLAFGTLLPGQSASGTITVVTEPGSPNPVELVTTAVSVTPPAGDPASDTASVIILRQTEMMSIY